MPEAKRPRLLYLVTEDWFFCSHFLPMARAAQNSGWDVAVAARVRAHRAMIEAEGFRLIEVEAERKSLNPLAIVSTIFRIRDILRQEKPDVFHTIALRAIVTGGLAARLAGVKKLVIALTGLGFLGARQDALGRMARGGIKALLRRVIETPETHYLFENRTDPVTLGLDPENTDRVTIIGGAGVDETKFTPAALPPMPSLKIAFIARMLWSKGADLAVEAVTLARAAGHDVSLSLYGWPDANNPKAVSQAQLEAWSKLPCIQYHGATKDAASVWAAHHLAIVPSRGGEGLPRTLLEAAACGRAILTTDVPGCRDFTREGVEGMVVPANDAEALAKAIVTLAKQPKTVEAMGIAARARLIEGYTETVVGRDVASLYQRLMAR